ncbi:diaminopimelate epimerase [Verrucomicrobiota bacterium]
MVEEQNVNVAFWKMHGAGNDFILVDDRAGTFPCDDREWLARTCARRTGVGCEGVILIRSSDSADFRMRFFNPDGSEVEMCGNGVRCVARLAHELGIAPQSMRIETAAGEVSADVAGERVSVGLTPPGDWRMDSALSAQGRQWRYSFVNTGVPHAVIEIGDLDACDVHGLGRALRHHPDFAPAGTNADFVQVVDPQAIRIRTYERGVEAETLACGTGIVAGALVAARLGRVRPPVSVTPASGDRLTVEFSPTADGAEDVVLEGPAVHVFKGSLDCSSA